MVSETAGQLLLMNSTFRHLHSDNFVHAFQYKSGIRIFFLAEMTEMRDIIFYKAYKALATDLKAFFDQEGQDVLKSIADFGYLGFLEPQVLSRSTNSTSRVRFLEEYTRSLSSRSDREIWVNFLTLLSEKRSRGFGTGGVHDEFNHLHVERPASLGISPLSDRNMETIPFTNLDWVCS